MTGDGRAKNVKKIKVRVSIRKLIHITENILLSIIVIHKSSTVETLVVAHLVTFTYKVLQ